MKRDADYRESTFPAIHAFALSALVSRCDSTVYKAVAAFRGTVRMRSHNRFQPKLHTTNRNRKDWDNRRKRGLSGMRRCSNSWNEETPLVGEATLWTTLSFAYTPHRRIMLRLHRGKALDLRDTPYHLGDLLRIVELAAGAT